MKIELHINGQFLDRWFYDDIRATDYSEADIKKCQERIESLIGSIKVDIYKELENCDYKFYVIYQSNLNFWNYSEADVIKFNKEINRAS